MVTLTCVCESYSGWDDGEVLTVTKDETFDVSDAKAEQLLADFPKWFTRVTPATLPVGATPKPRSRQTKKGTARA